MCHCFYSFERSGHESRPQRSIATFASKIAEILPNYWRGNGVFVGGGPKCCAVRAQSVPPPMAFQGRLTKQRQVGFLAQEVETVLRELVATNAQGYKSVAYQNVVSVLVEAVKTLKRDNDSKKNPTRGDESRQCCKER